MGLIKDLRSWTVSLWGMFWWGQQRNLEKDGTMLL